MLANENYKKQIYFPDPLIFIELTQNKKLKSSVLRVLLFLIAKSNSERKVRFDSKILVEEFGGSSRNARDIIKTLKDAGYITKLGIGMYRINIEYYFKG